MCNYYIVIEILISIYSCTLSLEHFNNAHGTIAVLLIMRTIFSPRECMPQLQEHIVNFLRY